MPIKEPKTTAATKKAGNRQRAPGSRAGAKKEAVIVIESSDDGDGDAGIEPAPVSIPAAPARGAGYARHSAASARVKVEDDVDGIVNVLSVEC
jgi:hypothetical protein